MASQALTTLAASGKIHQQKKAASLFHLEAMEKHRIASGMIRRSIALLICTSMLVLSGCTLWAEPKRVNWNNATGAEQLERLLWQSIQQKDWQSLDSRLASTFVSSSAEGVMNKEQMLAHIKQMEITDVSIGDLQVIPAGNDMILTYTLLLKGLVNGQPISSSPMHVMSVWQQQKKGWALQAWAR